MVRTLPAWHFDVAGAARTLARHFGTQDLAAFGVSEMPLGIAAAGALFGYASATQQTALAHVRALEAVTTSAYVHIDPATRRNLEIVTTLNGEPTPTLHSLLDRCVTAAGSRTLRQWLTLPRRDPTEASARHDAIEALLADDRLRRSLHEALKRTADVERIAARIALASVRPRELAVLRDTLLTLPALSGLLAEPARAVPLLADAAALRLTVAPQWAALLVKGDRTVEPSTLVREGGVIASGS